MQGKKWRVDRFLLVSLPVADSCLDVSRIVDASTGASLVEANFIFRELAE
ncbi:hypothetical protein BH10PLA2_BH10PLA2_29960 [soil metagenome]